MLEMVLLPGWAMPATIFAPLLPLLPAHCRVTIITPRYGATLADSAAAAIQHAPPRAVWLGWSLGGMIAAQVAADFPDRVATLINIATNLVFVARQDWPHAMAAATLAAFEANFAAAPQASLSRFLTLQCQGSTTARADRQKLQKIIHIDHAMARQTRHDAAAHAELGAGLKLLRNADMRDVVGRIRCPSFWLYGADDALVPVAVAADIATRLASARTARLANCSHVPFLSSPDRVAAAIHHLLVEPA